MNKWYDIKNFIRSNLVNKCINKCILEVIRLGYKRENGIILSLMKCFNIKYL
jgi:hypothetical protein